MPSFGEKLKREREKRSITLEQISLSTKIGTRMLQALEEDKFNQLPGGIFNKGFVRAYARFVGLDEDQTISDYLEASGEAPARIEPAAEPPPHSSEPAPRPASRDLPWALFAAVLLVVALALSIWSYRKREQRVSSSPAPAAQQVSSPTATEPASNSTANAAAPAKASPSPNAATKQAPAVPPSSTAAPTPALPGEFTVLIHAREDSWISITADGRLLFSDILVSDSDRTVHGRKEVIVKTGNTGAVDFSFNGKRLSPQGDYGEVKTVTFSAAGLQPNAPAPATTQ